MRARSALDRGHASTCWEARRDDRSPEVERSGKRPGVIASIRELRVLATLPPHEQLFDPNRPLRNAERFGVGCEQLRDRHSL